MRAPTICILVCLFNVSHAWANPPSLAVAPARASPTDLKVSGPLLDGEPGYVAHADLLELGVEEMALVAEGITEEPLEMTVLDQDKLIRALGADPSETTIITHSHDGYWSFYAPPFRETFTAIVILEVEGRGPAAWAAGTGPDPGPYFFSMAENVPLNDPRLRDPSHKRPWGVTEIELVDYETYFALLYAKGGDSSKIAKGRKVFINNCMSCHASGPPPEGIGGSLSNRHAIVLAAHAKYNADYFQKMIQQPLEQMPNINMPAHAHYSDEDIEAIRAYVASFMP